MSDSQSSPPLLQMQNISKSFPGVKALDNVSLTVRAGTVHALMGENGAGKSTLMKCLFGIYSADSGRVLLQGKEVRFKNPKEALLCGVAMVHQELNQALKRNVSDNIWLGRYPTRFGIFVKEGQMRRDTEKIFADLEVTVSPTELMGNMPVSRRQMVEIAKAVSYNSSIIVLDEPTSSLSESEVERLFAIIRRLKERGCGIIYISHKMEEILQISDDITIMRDGRHIATRPASEMTLDEMIRLMVGRELTERFPKKTNLPCEVIFEARGIKARYCRLYDVSFSLRRGEILGVAGLGGSGRTELLETIFGLSERQGGSLFCRGEPIDNRSPRSSIANGFALLTEERAATGIFGILSIRENTVISSLRRHLRGGLFLSERAMRRDTQRCIDLLKIKTPSQSTKIRTLSGGNQQKVILGRWLLTEPDILLLDEPTRGIDVGAKYEIYRRMIELASEGKSIVMVSSEMPELLGVCDRIIVMSGGRSAGEVDAKSTSQEEIMALAAKYV